MLLISIKSITPSVALATWIKCAQGMLISTANNSRNTPTALDCPCEGLRNILFCVYTTMCSARCRGDARRGKQQDAWAESC